MKDIITVCLECGNKHRGKNKEMFGTWIDTCDMCGKKNVSCASAPHDFGIYSSDELKIKDEIQDLI
jgi:hypothetical protein